MPIPRLTASFGAAVATLAVLLASCSGPGRAPESAPATLTIPISPAGGLGQFNLSSNAYQIANRFVLPQGVTVDRWYFAINGEGADCVGGRRGYGNGNGGLEYGRIVEVDQSTGLPTSTILGSERVNACDNYDRAMSEFGLEREHQVQFVQFTPVTLRANTMYAFVLSNEDPDPGDGRDGPTGNYMSPNLNLGDLKQFGPNARNTLEATATGAVDNLDPRETTMWSSDQGLTWSFGDRVGWYQVGNGSGRLWPGGYRIAGGANLPRGWPYMNWPSDGPGSITITAPVSHTFTIAGGSSSSGKVGVITVTNDSTGDSATTESLGAGLVNGSLSKPVAVAKGETYTIETRGTVGTGSAASWDKIYKLGTIQPFVYTSSCRECGSPQDHPMLYAAP